MRAVSHAADIKDPVGAFFVLGAAYALCTRLQLIWADMGLPQRTAQGVGRAAMRVEVGDRPAPA